MFNINKKIKESEQIEVETIEEMTEKLQKKNGELNQRVAELSQQNVELSSSLSDTRDKIRTQTEADVYFTSAKIMRELEGGKKVDDMAEQIAHRNRLYGDSLRAQQQIGFSELGMLGR